MVFVVPLTLRVQLALYNREIKRSSRLKRETSQDVSTTLIVTDLTSCVLVNTI